MRLFVSWGAPVGDREEIPRSVEVQFALGISFLYGWWVVGKKGSGGFQSKVGLGSSHSSMIYG
jgi:hypothetical protein